MVSNPSRVDVESENPCAKFLMQFTAEEQTTLMGWIEQLVAARHLEVDATHPLSAAFDLLAKYISGKIDTFPSGEHCH